MLGLGCENSNIGELKRYIGEYDEERVKFLVCQECEDEMEEGARLLDRLIDYAACFTREKISVSKLVIGMKCGGSDGFSGITANPLVGRFSDFMIDSGGTTILTEVPEMFGAETLLMNSCASKELFATIRRSMKIRLPAIKKEASQRWRINRWGVRKSQAARL